MWQKTRTCSASRETDAAGTVLVRYVPGPGVDQRVAMISASGVVHFYHADRLGNVIAMADSAGAVTDQYVYSPFGVEDVAAASGNPFRYTGRRYDPETGLYYYRARYYDPVLGRFLQTDPIGYADQMNLYAYVGNDPVNLTDPTGMWIEDVVIGVPSAAIGIWSAGSNALQGNWGAAAIDVAGVGADVAAIATPGVPGGAGFAIQGTRRGVQAANAAGDAARLGDDALVVRGGTNTADRFTNGSGVTTNADGTLNGVSVNSAPGASVEELSAGIPNNQIGVSTVGDVRAAGGDVVPSPTANNPNHCTMCGVTAEQAEELFTPTIRNPNK